jgi:hypothetical protein
MIGMSRAWLTLIEQHIKNSETALVCDTPIPPMKSSDDLK